MSQILSKAPRRPQETRSQAGIGMGSHSTFRELVGRSMRFVQNPNERMGFGQGEGVEPCPRLAGSDHMRGHARAGYRARQRTRGRHPLPPPVARYERGLPAIFPLFFVTMLKRS